ncbi:MAG: TonB-dependent receptor [Candidatus Omnitrophota bacterium]|nr:TonB-dependent receptor [Candidatus Omnitrophota bacterium]
MRFYRVITLSLITGVSLAVLSVCAQTGAAETAARKEQPLDLGKVVVSPTKTERMISDVPESVTLITKKDLEETTARYVDDALRYEAGIDVDRGKGGLSSPSTFVYMRGFPHPRAVAVLMDGVPINRAVCGGVKWDEMPVSIVDRVEIMRGAGSTLYGSGAEAGVISITTEDPGDKAKFIIEETYGSHNTWESVATMKGPLIGNLGGLVSYNHLQTDGFYPYAGSDPVFRAAQVDNYRYADNLFGKLVYKFDDITSLSASYSYWKDEVSMGRRYMHKDIERNRVVAGFKRKGDVFDVNINAFYLDEEFVDYMDHKMYQACGNVAQVRHRPGKDTGVNLAVSFPLMEGQAIDQTFTVGGDYRWAEMKDKLEGMTKNRPIFEKDETAEGKQHRASIFCQDEIEMGEVLLNLSARFDWYRSYDGHHYKKQWRPRPRPARYVVIDDTGYSTKSDSAFNWKIGTVYHVTDSTALRGSFARAFHVPYLYSLYATTECPPGKTNEGNPGLKPEYVLAYEAGVDQKIGEDFTVRLTGFYNDITDWMETAYRTAVGGRKYEWSNVDKAVTAGLELEGEYKATEDITLFANYTYLYTEVKKFKCPPASTTIGHPYAPGDYEGNRLANQPGNKTNFGVIFDNPDILTFSLICRYVGQRFDDLENTKSMKSYFTADLLLARKLTEFLEVSLEINDLFDETWQEDYDWLASPGRTIMGKVKLSF